MSSLISPSPSGGGMYIPTYVSTSVAVMTVTKDAIVPTFNIYTATQDCKIQVKVDVMNSPQTSYLKLYLAGTSLNIGLTRDANSGRNQAAFSLPDSPYPSSSADIETYINSATAVLTGERLVWTYMHSWSASSSGNETMRYAKQIELLMRQGETLSIRNEGTTPSGNSGWYYFSYNIFA